MKSGAILAALVGISLVLAAMIHTQQAVNGRLEQSLADIGNLPKAERDRFYSNAAEFYQHSSKAARKERERLRDLYHRIHNAPESERLTKTLEQYVDWVNRFSDPATMRVIQSKSIDARVEDIHQAIRLERINNAEPPITMERLKENLRESLSPELLTIVLPPISKSFDDWLTQKYGEAKTGLSEDQLHQLPILEKFYRDLFRHAGMEPSSAETPEIPEKLTMLQLIQNLSPRQGGGGSVPARFPGGPRMGGGGYFYVRPGGAPLFFGGGGLRDDFFEQFESILLDQLDASSQQSLTRLNRLQRTETLQRILALAVLEQHPTIDAGRFLQASSRTEQQEWIKILGVYLAMMEPPRREEFLTQDSRSTLNRLQGDLLSHAMAYFGLFRIRPPDNRPPGMGPPPSPRGNPPPDIGPDRPRPENGQDRERDRDQRGRESQGRNQQGQAQRRGQG